MFKNRILVVFELLVGILLVAGAFFNGKETGFGNALGFQINIKNTVLIAGIFYSFVSLTDFILGFAEPSSRSFIRTFLILFEAVCGFILGISSLCDGKVLPIESYFGVDISVHYGLGILGVYYTTRALFQVIMEQGQESLD